MCEGNYRILTKYLWHKKVKTIIISLIKNNCLLTEIQILEHFWP